MEFRLALKFQLRKYYSTHSREAASLPGRSQLSQLRSVHFAVGELVLETEVNLWAFMRNPGPRKGLRLVGETELRLKRRYAASGSVSLLNARQTQNLVGLVQSALWEPLHWAFLLPDPSPELPTFSKEGTTPGEENKPKTVRDISLQGLSRRWRCLLLYPVDALCQGWSVCMLWHGMVKLEASGHKIHTPWHNILFIPHLSVTAVYHSSVV